MQIYKISLGSEVLRCEGIRVGLELFSCSLSTPFQSAFDAQALVKRSLGSLSSERSDSLSEVF